MFQDVRPVLTRRGSLKWLRKTVKKAARAYGRLLKALSNKISLNYSGDRLCGLVV
jgi:hypothetical protein